MSVQGLDTVMARINDNMKDRLRSVMGAVAVESVRRIQGTLDVPYTQPRTQNIPYRRKGFLRDGISHAQSEPSGSVIRETIRSTRVEGDSRVPRILEQDGNQNSPPLPYMFPEVQRLESDLLPNVAAKMKRP